MGVGAPAKPMGTKARANADKVPFRVMGLPEVPQPPLPLFFRFYDRMLERPRKIKYPPETVAWWSHWEFSPLNDGFTQHDWDYLLEVSIVHAQFWLDIDRMKAAAELRQRMAKFGVTPEDRAKLRIVSVTADNAEETAEEARRLNSKIAIVGEGRRLTAIPGFAS